MKLPVSIPPRAFILGVPISVINLKQAVEILLGWARERKTTFVCIRDVNGIMIAQKDSEFMNLHFEAGMVTPDGRPVYWMTRLLGFSDTSQVCGRDLMAALSEASRKDGLRHFFYGAGPSVAEKLAQHFSKRFPGLVVAGVETPPFRPLTPEEDEKMIARINETKPHFVWVGLGAPKQEFWMKEHSEKIPGAILLGVGAAFDFHAGTKKTVPPWMQKTGLEWLFRLVQEPRRLWKRYLIGNFGFCWLVFLEMTGLRKRRPS